MNLMYGGFYLCIPGHGYMENSETEAIETKVWIEPALLSALTSEEILNELFPECKSIMAQLVVMINQPEKWIIKPKE